MAMLNFLQDTLGHEKLTVHGFRSTFRDWAGENTDKEYDDTVIEHALAHKSSDQTRNAYQRGDYLEKRKILMQDWADYCYSAVTAPASSS
jgi:integrase